MVPPETNFFCAVASGRSSSAWSKDGTINTSRSRAGRRIDTSPGGLYEAGGGLVPEKCDDSRWRVFQARSVEVEIDLHADLNRHWFSVFHGRLKLPGFHGFDGFFVQAQTQRAGHANVAGTSIRANHQP